jgi:hypothetical protein
MHNNQGDVDVTSFAAPWVGSTPSRARLSALVALRGLALRDRGTTAAFDAAADPRSPRSGAAILTMTLPRF